MFEIIFHDRARKAYERLHPNAARLVNRSVDALALDPFNALHVKRLHGELAGCYRMRAGDYRIVYQIDGVRRFVVILALGPRGNVY